MCITSSTNSWLEFILKKECFGGAEGIFFFGNAFLSYKIQQRIQVKKKGHKANIEVRRNLQLFHVCQSYQLFSAHFLT